jgi:hypothetical protein
MEGAAADHERRLQRLQEILDELTALTDWKKLLNIQSHTSVILSPFSVSTFPVRGLRVLRHLMEEKAGRAEGRAASVTGFRVELTQLSPTVRALRAGSS